MRDIPRFRIPLLLALGLALTTGSGCQSPVYVDVAETAPFGRLSTWAWHPHPVAYETWRAGDPELEDAMKATVEDAFAARGYRKTDAESADFRVTVYAEIGSEIEIRTESRQNALYSNTGTTPSYLIESEAKLARVYETGHLLIDVSDPQGQMIWRGASMRRVRGVFDEEAKELAAAIVREFPAAAN